MNVGIDINPMIFDRSGFGRYTSNMVKNILMVDRKNHYFLYANFLRNRSKRKKIIDDLIEEAGADNVTIRISPLPARWREFIFGLPLPIDRFYGDPLDLYWAPHFVGVPVKGFGRKIVSIHDLVFMRFKEHRGKGLSRYYLKRTQIAIDRSDAIVAVSGCTKRDLIKMLDVPASKIKVIGEGVDEIFRPLKKGEIDTRKISPHIPPGSQYILAVGTIEPRKNLILAVKAFSLLPEKHKRKYKLVFVGPKGWNSDKLYETIVNYNLKERVIFTGFVSDEALPYIYNQAAVFIYPSLYEGFGLPVLEALACGVPVVASNTSSLPEVVGDAGFLIDPLDEEELALAIRKVIESPKFAERMRARSVKQAKNFSWQKAAREMVKLFEKTGKTDRRRSVKIKAKRGLNLGKKVR